MARLPLYEEVSALDQDLLNDQLDWATPTYIRDNLIHDFRYYQDGALRFFHYSQAAKAFAYRNINHVLFNMATGSGKTDLMAGLILYLYQEHGYQNFLFLVNTTGVLTKTIDNLTNKASDKYLYKSQIIIDGERIDIQRVKIFPKVQSENTIYLKLDTVQSVASDLYTQKENAMGEEDYRHHKVAILGDEAHHYSASTKSEKEAERSWEKAIDMILNARKDNKLLEFTATIDLNNRKVYEKYKDKILYLYKLDRFIADRYSKVVKRIQSSNTDIDNMLNAMLLSEFRRLYALEKYGTYIKPVLMFKSQRIEASNEAHEKFNRMIEQLTVDQLNDFLQRQIKVMKDSDTLSIAHNFYLKNKEKWPEIIRDIQREFGSNRIINANDTTRSGLLEKGQYEALNSLESPSNLYRVIFAVARLTEGWDVLNLYDIVRLSDDLKAKGTKATTNSEAQLIGRGARYYPFLLNGKRSFQRRFEDESTDSLILETIHYHTINEPQYLKNLVKSLDEMDLPTGADSKNPLLEVKVKPSFKRTNAWKFGKIYYNETVEVPNDYYDRLDKYGVNTTDPIYIDYYYSTKETSYRDENIYADPGELVNVPLQFDERYHRKVMNRLPFYHFNNLKKYLPLLKSREEFLYEPWLNLYGSNRTIYVRVPISMKDVNFKPVERLKLLEQYFIEVAQQIKKGFGKRRGTGNFTGYPIKEYLTDYKKRIPNYDTGSLVLYENPQYVQRYELKDDYYVYDSAIVNVTERQLIDRIAERVDELKEQYDDVYLIRMDENMHRESAKSEHLKLHQYGNTSDVQLAGFQPDFILYLKNADCFIQIFIEPKGRNLEEDQWKEDLLSYLNKKEEDIVFEEDIDHVKIRGVRFYTMNDGRNTIQQIGELVLEEGFKNLSLK